MKSPRMTHALTASLLVHLSFVLLAVLIMSRAGVYHPPAPYVVSLVDDRAAPAASRSSVRDVPVSRAAEPPKTTKQSVQAPQPQPVPKNKARQVEEERLMKERIEALEAKKRIEKLVSLRKVVEVDASKPAAGKPAPKITEKAAAQGTGSGAPGAKDYYALVVDRIRQQWIFPGALDRDLEAVIAIRIARDGRVTIERIEKGSGNPLFDRSVVRAITLASPLPPPPQDMDIGVRFRP